MMRQLLIRNTTQMGQFFSFSHLCASKSLKLSNECLIFRKLIVPMTTTTMRLPNESYSTTGDLKKKQMETSIKAKEHVALRKLFSPQITNANGDKRKEKIKKPKKNSTAVRHVGRLDMRVGRIVEIIKPPYTDTLYVTKVDIGGETRSIAVGLAKFVSADQLLNQKVVVLCNIKPAPLNGQRTDGMIMCAKSGNIKEPLTPPPNAEPGDLVYCENFDRIPHKTPRYKRDIFDPLTPDLNVNNELVACYKSCPLFIRKKGNIVVKSLKNANIT